MAAHTGLPALDVDGMGRAFPELQMFCPFIYGLKAYPGAVADDKEDSVVSTHADTANILEEFFRKETVWMGYVAVLSITHTHQLTACLTTYCMHCLSRIPPPLTTHLHTHTHTHTFHYIFPPSPHIPRRSVYTPVPVPPLLHTHTHTSPPSHVQHGSRCGFGGYDDV